MRIFNSNLEYGLLAKLFHWVTFLILIGITIFYITLFRLIWKFMNPSPTSTINAFKGQALIAKLNHFLLYFWSLSYSLSLYMTA